MSFLLKITEGLMRGAEIALISGERVKLGSSEDCDIVLPDTTLPPLVCELDVSDHDVTVVMPDGDVRRLEPFRIFMFGESFGFAIGPDEGEWEELKPAEKPAVEPESTAEQDVGDGHDGDDGAPEGAEASEDGGEDSSSGSEAEGTSKDDGGKTSSGGSHWLLWLLLLLLLLIGVAVLLWFWTPAALQETRESVAVYFHKLFGDGKNGGDKVIDEPLTLEKLASDHGLELKRDGSRASLKGNFTLRTERLAVRALALSADRTVRLDLTDDESQLTAAQALAFTVSGTDVTVVEAANRRVKLSGRLKKRAELLALQEAFRKDMPSVERLDCTSVATDEDEMLVQVEPPVAPAPETVSKSEPKVDPKEPVKSEPKVVPEAPVSVAVKTPVSSGPLKLPVAGILTAPYPCVVLQNGVRCVAGANLGEAVIERIEPGRLTLRVGKRVVVWTL